MRNRGEVKWMRPTHIRLCCWFFVWLCGFCSVSAWASFPATATPTSVWNPTTCWSGFSGVDAAGCTAGKSAHTPQEAGDQAAAANNMQRGDGPPATGVGGAQGGGTWFGCGPGGTECWATNNGKQTLNLWRNNTTCAAGSTYNPATGMCDSTTYFCPVGSTSSGSGSSMTCTCNSGYLEQGGTCVANNCPAQGTTASQSVFWGYDTNGDGMPDDASAMEFTLGTIGTTFSRSGCGYQTTAGATRCYNFVDAPSKIYCDFPVAATGFPAPESATNGDVPPSGANPCPPGTVAGEVNGVPNQCLSTGPSSGPWVPPAPTSSSTTSNTVSNPDGTTTTTTTTTSGGPGGSSTTTTTVKGADGSVISQTSVTSSAAGAGGGSGRGKSEQAEFCRDNPNSPMCKEKVWGGSCGSYMCEGDAILCALTKLAHEQQCAADASDEAAFYRAALADMPTAEQAARALNKNGAHDINVQSIFDEHMAAQRIVDRGGACPAPVVVLLPWGGSVSVSFALFCSLADVLRYFVLAGAGVVALRILIQRA